MTGLEFTQNLIVVFFVDDKLLLLDKVSGNHQNHGENTNGKTEYQTSADVFMYQVTKMFVTCVKIVA